MCNNISSAPSIEKTPPNTIERTIKLENPFNKTPTSRGDLRVHIFPEEYEVGGILTYPGMIQADARNSLITVNQGLVWMLLKKDELLDTQRLFHTQIFNKPFSAIFKKNGFIKFAYTEDKVRVRTSNTIIEYDGITYDVPFTSWKSFFSFSIDLGMPLYEFTEPGHYTLQVHFMYDLEGKKYKTMFESEEFEVREKKHPSTQNRLEVIIYEENY